MSTKAKTTTSQRARKQPAKSSQKRGSFGPTGSLTGSEKQNLALQAKDAFKHQKSQGRVDPDTNENDWRREQVEDVTGKAGVSKLNRSDFRPVKAHFLTLAGREDEAFALLNKTGTKAYRPTSPADTHESAEAVVALIMEALITHANKPAASLHSDKGHIHAGWFLACARQRTAKPTLTMETLANRLDAVTLTGLLSHLRNHIALREGRADLDRRSKRTYPKKADPGEMADTL
jgi:hypothetical protein